MARKSKKVYIPEHGSYVTVSYFTTTGRGIYVKNDIRYTGYPFATEYSTKIERKKYTTINSKLSAKEHNRLFEIKYDIKLPGDN